MHSALVSVAPNALDRHLEFELFQDVLHVLAGEGVLEGLLLDEADLVIQLMELLQELPFCDWGVEDVTTYDGRTKEGLVNG